MTVSSSEKTTNSTNSPNKKAAATPLSAAGVSQWVLNTSKLLLQPETYSKRNLTAQWQRSKRVAGLAKTIQEGVGYAWQVHQAQHMSQDDIICFIQKFCRSALTALQVEVIAVKPIPPRQPHTGTLWASNHISWLDIPVIGSVIPTFFLSKAEIGRWPVIGWLATTANTLFIERGSGDSDNVIEQMETFLKDGYPVVFFPEATTGSGRKMRRIHGKLLQSVMDSQVPIQPMVICYVNAQGEFDEAIPYFGKMTMLQSIKRVLDNGPAKAYVLPLEPILPEGKTRTELTNLLQQRMNDGLQYLHQQVINTQG